jgi:hypothetical protein
MVSTACGSRRSATSSAERRSTRSERIRLRASSRLVARVRLGLRGGGGQLVRDAGPGALDDLGGLPVRRLPRRRVRLERPLGRGGHDLGAQPLELDVGAVRREVAVAPELLRGEAHLVVGEGRGERRRGAGHRDLGLLAQPARGDRAREDGVLQGQRLAGLAGRGERVPEAARVRGLALVDQGPLQDVRPLDDGRVPGGDVVRPGR